MQGSRGQNLLIAVAVITASVLVLGTVYELGGGENASPTGSVSSPGVAPLGPSHAGVMTPEWEQFALQVDYACSDAYNTTAPERLAADREAARQGVPGYKRDAVGWGYIAQQEKLELQAITAMGEPPSHRALFHRWVANVAERERLLVQTSEAAAAQDFGKESRLSSEIGSLKAAGDRLASRFGLRVCSTKPPR